MLKKCLSLLLVGLLMEIASPTLFAKSTVEKDAQKAEKVRAGILSLGVGPDARIKVKLKDQTKLEGYIKEAGDDQFVITNSQTGTDTLVAYPQVATAKGQNLSKGAKIAIGVGVAAAVVVVVLFILFHGFTPS